MFAMFASLDVHQTNPTIACVHQSWPGEQTRPHKHKRTTYTNTSADPLQTNTHRNDSFSDQKPTCKIELVLGCINHAHFDVDTRAYLVILPATDATKALRCEPLIFSFGCAGHTHEYTRPSRAPVHLNI